MNEGYTELFAAITKQCLVDYRTALARNDIGTVRECERYLRSEWFAFLSDMNGEGLIAMMREDAA